MLELIGQRAMNECPGVKQQQTSQSLGKYQCRAVTPGDNRHSFQPYNHEADRSTYSWLFVRAPELERRISASLGLGVRDV
jgi:hypothetical protein